jgi:hypothetical protein
VPDTPEQYSLPPASRDTDPESSHEAEAKHKARGSHKNMALILVRRYPGSTAQELAIHCEHLMLHHELLRRLCDLADHRDGRIYRGEQRKCRVTGRKMLTWHPDWSKLIPKV